MKKNYYYSRRRHFDWFPGINWGPALLLLLIVVAVIATIVGLVMAAPHILAFVVDSFYAMQGTLLTITAIGMFGSLITGIIFFCNKKEDSGYAWFVVTGILFLLGFVMTRL